LSGKLTGYDLCLVKVAFYNLLTISRFYATSP